MPTFPPERSRITVRVNGTDYVGWLQSTVERSMEAIAGTFTIPVTLIPGQPPAIKRQDQVQVRIAETPVITGTVLAAEPFYRDKECGLRVVGRDRTGDLVRSAAIHNGGQWRRVKLDSICRDLLKPFGVELVVETNVGDELADFKLNHGESVLDAVSRAARLRGVLVSRDDVGRLLLTRAGSRKAPGAIVRGQNVISMESIGSDEYRHSTYIAYAQSNVAGDFESARQIKAQSFDKEVGRYLPLVINADGNITKADLQALVDHTARVRRGHAYGYRYVVEGWTCNGEPWPLNARVPIHDDVAGLDGHEWLISSVRSTCDPKDGDVTELVVRPVEAYDTVPLKTKVKHRKADRKRGNDGARLVWGGQ